MAPSKWWCWALYANAQESHPVCSRRKQKLEAGNVAYKFLRNYRATPHSSTGVTPAEALFGRKIKVKLPEAPTIPNSHSRHAHLDTHMRQRGFLMKKKMKNYAEAKRNISTTDIQVGNTVLVREPKKNKLTPYYNPNPMQVTAKKGPMLTVKQPGGTRITRNSSHFKMITAAGSSLQPLNQPENPPDGGGMNDDDLCPVPLDDEHFLQSSDVQQPPDQPLPDSLASHQTPRKYPMRVRVKPSYLKDYVLKWEHSHVTSPLPINYSAVAVVLDQKWDWIERPGFKR